MRWNIRFSHFYHASDPFRTILMRSGGQRIFPPRNIIKSTRSFTFFLTPSSHRFLLGARFTRRFAKQNTPALLFRAAIAHGSGDGREDRIDSRRMAAGAQCHSRGTIPKSFSLHIHGPRRLHPTFVYFVPKGSSPCTRNVGVSAWLVEFSVKRWPTLAGQINARR